MTVGIPLDPRCEDKLSSVIPNRGLSDKHSVLPTTFVVQSVNTVHEKNFKDSNKF